MFIFYIALNIQLKRKKKVKQYFLFKSEQVNVILRFLLILTICSIPANDPDIAASNVDTWKSLRASLT